MSSLDGNVFYNIANDKSETVMSMPDTSEPQSHMSSTESLSQSLGMYTT